MISDIFSLLIYNPLYNALIFLISTIPFADVGIAVILLTVLVKLALFPLAKQAIKTQIAMRRIAPELEEIKRRNSKKEDQQRQVKETMTLYKKNNIKPFSGFMILLIQLPIILGLYWVFLRGGLPEINTKILYSFVKNPEFVNMNFLGLVDMGGKNIVLSLLAGITQFIHTKIAMPAPETKSKPGESIKDDITRSLHIQMKYILPVIITIIAYTISSAIALYWTTSNLFTIGQELFIRKKGIDTNIDENNHE